MGNLAIQVRSALRRRAAGNARGHQEGRGRQQSEDARGRGDGGRIQLDRGTEQRLDRIPARHGKMPSAVTSTG